MGTEQTAWAFLDRDGAWKTGLLTWPLGEDPKVSVWHGPTTPVNYASAIVSDRQVHYIGLSPINIWNRIDPSKTETWGRGNWDWRMCYGVLTDGEILEKRVLLAGGETTGPVHPTGYIGHPRFHITPDLTMYVLCNLVGTTPETTAQTGTYALRIEPDGSVSAPVRIPLARRIPSTFFTATPRAGNRLTESADLLIADTVDGKPVARYARIRFRAGD